MILKKNPKPTKLYKPPVACTYSEFDSWAEVHSGKCYSFLSVSCSSKHYRFFIFHRSSIVVFEGSVAARKIWVLSAGSTKTRCFIHWQILPFWFMRVSAVWLQYAVVQVIIFRWHPEWFLNFHLFFFLYQKIVYIFFFISFNLHNLHELLPALLFYWWKGKALLTFSVAPGSWVWLFPRMHSVHPADNRRVAMQVVHSGESKHDSGITLWHPYSLENWHTRSTSQTMALWPFTVLVLKISTWNSVLSWGNLCGDVQKRTRQKTLQW